MTEICGKRCDVPQANYKTAGLEEVFRRRGRVCILAVKHDGVCVPDSDVFPRCLIPHLFDARIACLLAKGHQRLGNPGYHLHWCGADYGLVAEQYQLIDPTPFLTA